MQGTGKTSKDNSMTNFEEQLETVDCSYQHTRVEFSGWSVYKPLSLVDGLMLKR